MRIALIAPPWVPVPPVAYGGTEAVLDALARGLLAAGHEVRLATPGDSTCDVPRISTVDHAVGTDHMSPALELAHAVRAYDHVAAWRPDVVHDHTMVGPLIGAGAGAPVLTTNHGPFDPLLRDCYRAIAARSSVIAISASHAASASGIPIEEVIHHGVDLQRYRPGPGGDAALFLGRMSPDKGVHTAIRAARAAGVPLRIAAKLREPDERAYFESVVRPMLGGDVEYLGEVGAEDKVRLLGESRCLLNPIQWAEPFGMVMIEALACGTPVVATRWGSVPEIVTDGETGFIRTGVTALAEAVLAAADLSRVRCRRRAEERFSMERMVRHHVEVYRRVSERAAGRPLRSVTVRTPAGIPQPPTNARTGVA